MKETKINIPTGYEIEKTEVVGDALTVTFKLKDSQLPRTWEEFCEMFPVTTAEHFINNDSCIHQATVIGYNRSKECDKNLLPDLATTESILALSQLISLRNRYNQGWKPDWTDDNNKYIIELYAGEIIAVKCTKRGTSPLYFKSAELRDQFLKYFRPLIEKLGPMFGIMNGDE